MERPYGGVAFPAIEVLFARILQENQNKTVRPASFDLTRFDWAVLNPRTAAA